MSRHSGRAGAAYRVHVLALLDRLGLSEVPRSVAPLVADFGRASLDLDAANAELEASRAGGTAAARREARREVYAIRSHVLALESRIAAAAAKDEPTEPRVPSPEELMR